MGYLRVAISALALAIASTAAVRAGDFGPRRAVREVRAAVPVLVHRDLLRLALGNTVGIDDVIVGSDNAIVDFHGPNGRGIATLTYKNATWWIEGSIFEDARNGWSWWIPDTPAAPASCATIRDVAPDASYLRQELAADPETVRLWSVHTPAPFSGQRPRFQLVNPSIRPNVCHPNGTYSVVSDTPMPIVLMSSRESDVPNEAGFRASWASEEPFPIAAIHGRAPTDAEMSGPGANSIFYLYANSGPKPLKAPRTRLEVWCPFVLDPSVHYFIEFAGPDKALGAIPGILDDNTLTFDIPEFSLPVNTDIRGEVDYLPLLTH